MTHRIQAGEYEALIVNEGAGLAALRRGGRDLVHPHDPEQTPIGYSGKVLVPWPNRIEAATYVLDGVRYTVPMNEPENNCALHGFAFGEDWDVVEEDSDAVELRTVTGPLEGYPFQIETSVRYTLSAEDGLGIEIRTTNTGDRTAPYGTGTHAYLTCDGAVADDCVLTVPAAEVLTVDQNLIPVGREGVAEAGLDYRGGAPIGANQIDHAFTSLPDGQWSVSLNHPESGMTVVLTSDEAWVQVFSGDNIERRGVAVEPMTCPPNAFNTGEDLILLAPGDSHTHRLQIREEV